jgi:hypothetical protein
MNIDALVFLIAARTAMLASARRLNHASRLALRWMTIRLFALLLIWFVPWLAGKTTLEDVLILLSPVFTLAAFVAMFVASAQREQIGAPSLNTWDEAVVFIGLAVLVHAVHRLAY